MPRALLVCSTIVAAFQLHLAAAPALVEDAPIAPNVAALASRLGVEPLRDRTRFMADMVRALYPSMERSPVVIPTHSAVNAGTRLITIPVPLPASTWAAAVFKDGVRPDGLIARILSDRRAAFLCHGLSGLDDETLGYLVEHPAVVTMLYEHGAAVFAAFGPALHIREGRVVTPGGETFAPLWQTLAAARSDQPDQFIRAVYAEFEGRLAYLLDTIEAARPEAAKFALGAWLPESVRVARFKSLFAATQSAYHEWHIADLPFSRPLGDLAMLLLRIRLDATSGLAAPASRAFWRQGLDSDGGDLLSGDVVDAAWLVSATGGEDMYSRVERLDQFAFGQRVFAKESVEPAGAAANVLRSFRRYRMLLLTFDRMGITTAGTYAGAIERASAFGDVTNSERFPSIAQFQGALAFIARLQAIGTIDRERAETLTRSLVAVPLGSQGYDGSLVHWWRSQIAPLLLPTGTWESRAIDALAGHRAVPSETRLRWEGQLYRVDLSFAERQRLTTVRGKQGGFTFDLVFALDDVSLRLRGDTVTQTDVAAAARTLRAVIADSAARLRHPRVNLLPPGVVATRDGLAWTTDLAERLERIERPGDLRRASALGESLRSLVDIAFGNVLLSFAYAADLGDPDGAAFLGGNVALRHDFGFAGVDAERRSRTLWAQPHQEVQPGVPWHVTGSILGLDLGLARLSLRRQSMDRIADAPKLSSIEREALALAVALLDPLRLTDQDRDRLVQGIGRGRARVAALTAGTETVEAVAADLGLDGYRQRSLLFAVQNEAATVAERFTLSDLLTLGRGAQATDLDAWGTPALQSLGCPCTSYVASRAWRVLQGRPQLPMIAATMGDLNLAMAVMLHDLDVPTSLMKSVLQVGMQDLVDGLDNRGDWEGISRAAQSLRRQRVEDYVSAGAVIDGPLVPIDDDSSRVQ